MIKKHITYKTIRKDKQAPIKRVRRGRVLRVESLESRRLLSASINPINIPYTTSLNITAINNSNQVVGYTDGSKAFVYQNGVTNFIGEISGVNGYTKMGFSRAFDINESGEITGDSYIVNGNNISTVAFTYSDGNFTNISDPTVPFYIGSSGYKLNSSGTVIGFTGDSDYEEPNNTVDTFVYSDGKNTVLTPSNNVNSSWANAQAINDAGEIVGEYKPVSSTTTEAVIFEDSKYVGLSANGYSLLDSNAINSMGDVVGDSFGSNGYLDQQGVIQTFTGRGVATKPLAINDSDQVVGNLSNDTPFLYENNLLTNLNALLPENSGWYLNTAIAINNKGFIIGQGVYNEVADWYILNLNSTTPLPKLTLSKVNEPKVNSTQIGLAYSIDKNRIDLPLQFDVYQSSTPDMSGNVVPISLGSEILNPSTDPNDLSLGDHSITISLDQHPITVDSTRPYIVVVANADQSVSEADGSVNTASILNSPAYNSSITLVSQTNPSIVGQPLTFTAKITSQPIGLGIPTGSVELTDGATIIGSADLDADGVAHITVPNLPVGSYSIIASYQGDSTYGNSQAAPLIQIVGQIPTKTTLSSSSALAEFDQTILLSAQVIPSRVDTSSLTGNVTFLDGMRVIGVASLDASGKASLSSSKLGIGEHDISAEYSGDSDHEKSAATFSQSVVADATDSVLAVDATAAEYGQAVTFDATVSPSLVDLPIPAGMVEFLDGESVLGTSMLDAAGKAVFSTDTLPIGDNLITAEYQGSGDDQGSSGSSPLTVNQSSTTTILASDPNPSSNGGPVEFTASISADFIGDATPSGPVTFLDGLTVLGEAMVGADGVATFSTSQLSGGDHLITAEYQGDSNYGGSSGSVPQSVTSPPIIALTGASASADGLSVNANYSITGSDLSEPGTIAFYWASGPNLADLLTDGSSGLLSTATQINAVPYSASLAIANLGPRPAKAGYVLAVLTSDYADPAHDVMAVSIPEPNIKILDAKALSPTDVTFDYSVAGDPGPFIVGVYRSSQPTFDTSAQLLGGGVFSTAANSSASGLLPLLGPLADDPSRPFLIVVADPPESGYPNGLLVESDKSDNTATIRLADIAVADAHLDSATSVDFDFDVTDYNGPFIAGLYRSASPVFDSTATLLTGGFYAAGSEGSSQGAFTLPAPLNYDPAQPYLIVVADPPEPGYVNGLVAESDKSNNRSTITLPISDIVMKKATTLDSKTLTVDYDIDSTAVSQDLVFNVYRSATPTYTPADLIATDTIYASDQSNLSVGSHEINLGIGNTLPPDTSKPYVTVVANADLSIYEENYYDDTAYFQIHELGAISHGYIDPRLDDPLNHGLTPSWETAMAKSLISIDKFDYVISFNWVLASSVDSPGRAVAAGQRLATDIADEANALVSMHSGDVVDLDLIGHSRGTVVISQALIDLEEQDSSLTNSSYIQMTLLDPHPATNFRGLPPISGYSAELREDVEDFQSKANDPQVIIPSNVQKVQLIYQNTPFTEFSSLSLSGNYYLNLWGEGSIDYSGGNNQDGSIIDYSTAAPLVVNLSSNYYDGIGEIGHSGVHGYFQLYFVNLGRALS